MNDLRFHIKKIKNKCKLKISRRKEIIKLRTEINDLDRNKNYQFGNERGHHYRSYRCEKIIRDYYAQLRANKFNNLKEMDKLSKNTIYQTEDKI